jgi:serine/threonine-protein kinase
MTQTGTVLGTSDYIAPEQAQGQRVDEHTDVYSLGVVLYELLTSEVPFPGENFVAVAMRHINEEPPPVRDKRPDVSPRLEAAIQCAMAKRPEDRFPTMDAFCAELEACLAETQSAGTQVASAVGGAALPPRVHHRRRSVSPWPVIVAIVALIAIGAVVALLILDGIPTSVPFTKSHGGGGAPAAAAANVSLAAINAYDPFGSPPGQEHNAQAPLATDGKPGTAWDTENYNSSFALLHKPGVGLILDAHSDVQLHHLAMSTGTPGFTAEIKASDSSSGPFDAVVSPSQTVADGTNFQIADGNKYRYYLIWITALPPPGTGIAEINEVRAN